MTENALNVTEDLQLFVKTKEGKQHLESLLIEGLDSGEPISLDGDEWQRIRSEVDNRAI